MRFFDMHAIGAVANQKLLINGSNSHKCITQLYYSKNELYMSSTSIPVQYQHGNIEGMLVKVPLNSVKSPVESSQFQDSSTT